MLRIRLHGDMGDEGTCVRKNCHETRRLYDSLCNCNLSRGGEKSADESGFGEHGGKSCLLLICSVGWTMGGENMIKSSECVLSKKIAIE